LGEGDKGSLVTFRKSEKEVRRTDGLSYPKWVRTDNLGRSKLQKEKGGKEPGGKTLGRTNLGPLTTPPKKEGATGARDKEGEGGFG